uniref:Ankyrin and armadillo repeat containing n=1 Tax=Scleropages formosus TaxID=113540 RepID=A0A8C9S3X3_SCLFO
MAHLATGRAAGSLQTSEDPKVEQERASALAARRHVGSFFNKYNADQVRELLSLTGCSWLLPADDLRLPADPPPGLVKEMRDFPRSTVVILTPADPRAPLDFKVIHQIVRELTVGIYCFNQVPFISLEANYDQSTSCRLTPAYVHTKVGQIFTELDYSIKALWHGAAFPKEKRVRFSELWRSIVGADASGASHTHKDALKEFLAAGLTDVSEDPSYKGIYRESVGCDPTYDPSSPEEEQLFRRHVDGVVLKLTAHLSAVRRSANLFLFEGLHGLSAAVRIPEDGLEPGARRRLRQRLAPQEALLRRCLERKAETREGLAYLRLVAFLVPLLVALKRTKKIPDVTRLLPAYSDDKLKTEEELPPLLLAPGFACKHFPYRADRHFHLHGGIEVDVGSPPLQELDEEMKVRKARSAFDLLRQDSPYREHLPVPVRHFQGKSYHVMAVELTALYPQPNGTQWWEAMSGAVRSLRAKRLPLTDVQLYEQFKKTFGYNAALKCKSVAFGLKAAVERGLAAAFHSLCRKNSPSLLGAPDEQGYSLAHHAAIHNRAHVLCQLSCSLALVLPGFTPLHLAAQCGSLEALSCLLALRADCKQAGRRGWMAVHFAAYYGQVPCLRALCRKDPALAVIPTTAQYQTYPLLLAASSGSVDALDYLLSIGTDWRQRDSEGNNIVHLAALYFHTHVLRHFLQLNLDELPVWRLLIEMLRSKDQQRVEMSIRCLEVLSLTVDSFWKDLMDADGIPALLELLGSAQPELQCMVLAVLCHMSERTVVREALMQNGAAALLVDLLGSDLPELQSRCAVVLGDLAAHSEHGQVLIAQLGGVAPLILLLGSDVHDVLVNVVCCIRVLCLGRVDNQTTVAEEKGLHNPYSSILTSTSTSYDCLRAAEVLQEESCAALAVLARGHAGNQDAICAAGATGVLVEILRSRKMTAQVKAASALEALVEDNATNQDRFRKLSAADQLLRLLKVFQLEVREQGAASLWALAGQTPKQQKLMAELMGYHFILDLLLAQSDRMQYVGCQAAMALSRENRSHQDGLCQEEVVPPLVRLLRGSRTTEKTLLSVIGALGTLCTGDTLFLCLRTTTQLSS